MTPDERPWARGEAVIGEVLAIVIGALMGMEFDSFAVSVATWYALAVLVDIREALEG